MFEKPKKPYKNLEDARLRSCIWLLHDDRLKDTSIYPCLACAGRGGIRKSKDLDPIEGYKMAPLYKCKKCDGSRLMPRKDFVVWYKVIVAEHKERVEAYNQIQGVVRGALDKLSDQEIEFLRGHLQYGKISVDRIINDKSRTADRKRARQADKQAKVG